ncbi:MAG: AraC family transcriptional regulator [Desulfovibrio sp.]|jgi:AraC-like DNA-binding protein|nr:AraC family transcriptional regulator [Desulfovibrio sp.]
MREKTDAERINALLKEKMLKRLPRQARIATPVEGLTLTRHDEISQAESCFYQPMVALIVQGFKRAMIGNEEYRYGERHCMVVGVDLPGVYHITEASAQAPFLSLSMKLNRYTITQLLAEMPPVTGERKKSSGAVVVCETPPEVLDAFSRLLDILDAPSKVPVLAPMILREIHFHLLAGSYGDCLRMVGTSGTQVNQIAQAVNWLRENYAEPLRVDDLAQRISMSPSTFHRHFRQVTTLSPLQFQKRLRLYEAERLMLLEGKDAGTAALAVGYESGSQFNREYKRQFGEPPHRNVNRKLSSGVFHAGRVDGKAAGRTATICTP